MEISNSFPSANVQLPFNMIVYIIEQLPLNYQKQILQMLSEKVNEQSANQEKSKLPLVFGAGKDFIAYIAPDFNAPLEDFKEYM